MTNSCLTTVPTLVAALLLFTPAKSDAANSEACIRREAHLVARPASGTAKTYYYGTQSIDVTVITGDTDESGSALTWYELDDQSRNLCTATFAGEETFEKKPQLLTSDDSQFDPVTDGDFIEENGAADIGLDLHWAAAKAYDYFLERHTWRGMSGDGSPVRLFVSYGDHTFLDNMFAYIDRDFGSVMMHGIRANEPFKAVLDVVGHEYTHNIIHSLIGDPTAPEAMAIDESLADIFGALVEGHALEKTVNWTIGEKTGTLFRNLEKPKSLGHADTFEGTNWNAGTTDDERAYIRAGVGNRWFYLLSQGGRGRNDRGDDYQVDALGTDESAAIAFSALEGWLPSEPTYTDLRQATITAAANLYGACSSQEEEVAKAWYAVGVGPEGIPAFQARLSTSGTRGQGPVRLTSDQSLVDPRRALRPLRETQENGKPSVSGQRGLDTFAKNIFIILGDKERDRVLPSTQLEFKNFRPFQQLIVIFPAYSTGAWTKPAKIKDERHNITKNIEERDKVDASYTGPGGFSEMFGFWETGKVTVDIYDLDCAISGSFAMNGDDGTTMTGTFRFRVDKYFDRRTDELVETAKH